LVDEHFLPGVAISSGKMPGPMQLLKLANNPKFKEAYAQVQIEFQKAGIDMQSKVQRVFLNCVEFVR
jgi:hypothetical protein